MSLLGRAAVDKRETVAGRIAEPDGRNPVTYRVQQNSAGRFEVLGGEGEVLFAGTLTACETWLDHQEGARQKTWKASIGGVLRKLIGKTSVAAHHDLTPAPSSEQKPAQ